jgi:hypothetical protein
LKAFNFEELQNQMAYEIWMYFVIVFSNLLKNTIFRCKILFLNFILKQIQNGGDFKLATKKIDLHSFSVSKKNVKIHS